MPPLHLRGLTASALRTAMSGWMPLDSCDDVKTGGSRVQSRFLFGSDAADASLITAYVTSYFRLKYFNSRSDDR